MTYDEHKREANMNDKSYCRVGMVSGKPSDDHGAVYFSVNFYYLKINQNR